MASRKQQRGGRDGSIAYEPAAAGKPMDRQVDVEAFEESCLRQSTSSSKPKQQIRSVPSA
jgi:hypothetical protein